MSIQAQQEIAQALRENIDAALRAMAAHDTVALKALAEQEARYMDELRACWSVDNAT